MNAFSVVVLGEEKKDTMSRLYDTVEPSVIDEEMLQKAVEEQGPKEEAGKIAKLEGIDYCDVFALRLDFKSKTIFFIIKV